MMTVVPELPAVRRAIEVESDRVVRRLRGASSLDLPVPGLAWTAVQLAAHLCVVYQAFAATVLGEFDAAALIGVVPEHRSLPETVAVANHFAVTLLAFAAPGEAADALEAAAGQLLAALDANPDLLADRPTPWYGPDRTRTVGTLASLAVTETLVHGRDLACALGGSTRMCVESAVAAAPTVLSEMMPLLLDRERAQGFTVGYELRVRGGPAFVLRIEDGAAWTEPVGGDGHGVDCVISMNACTALMIGFARQSVARAILSGGMIAFGRRPWLGPQLKTLFLTP